MTRRLAIVRHRGEEARNKEANNRKRPARRNELSEARVVRACYLVYGGELYDAVTRIWKRVVLGMPLSA